jgi:hypothetical protein
MWSQQLADDLRSTSNMKKHGLSISSENTSQNMFIRNDTISETVNDSDSGGGNFSERSDSDTCKVHLHLAAAAATAPQPPPPP